MKFKWKALLMAGVLAASVAAFAGCSDGNGGNGGNGGKGESEYGELSIEDLKVYINSDKGTTFAEIDPVFSKPEKKETLTYQYDKDSLKIENNIVTPLLREDMTVNVRAKSEHFNTIFKVNVEYVQFTGEGASPLYNCDNYPVGARALTCKAVTADTTLFIGDSFMDDYYIGDFMKGYTPDGGTPVAGYASDKVVLNAGMSSTTSYHWEASYAEIIGSTAPKNIVMHIGTNNFYDAHDSVQNTEESLKRLFMFMHTSYPTTNIYWFNITQRKDTAQAEKVTETNAHMAIWCASYDWITCVDTCSKVKTSMLNPEDGTHPTTENYHVFTDALVEAGCEIVAK